MKQFIFKNLKYDPNNLDSTHKALKKIFSEEDCVRFRIEEDAVIVRIDKYPKSSIQCSMLQLKDFIKEDSAKFIVRMNIQKRMYIKGKRGSHVPIRGFPQIVKKFKSIAEKNGFKVLNFTSISDPYLLYKEKNGQQSSFNTIDFEGHLKITDSDLFKQAYENGIGPSKNYGYGMLILDKG